MMQLKRLSKDTIRNIYSIIFGAITACILVFALSAVNAVVSASDYVKPFLFLTFLFLSFSRILMAAQVFHVEDKNKLIFIKNIVFAGAYLICAILSLAMAPAVELFLTLAIAYLLTIFANRILLMIQKRKLGSYIINSFLAVMGIFAIGLFIASSTTPEMEFLQITALLVIIIVISLIDVLGYAFYKMQLRGLLKIIRKTYVLEIIYGLIVLVISFSFYFYIMEEDITSFGDGLWYSFAVITTIGFGDIKVVSNVSRILSVILGLYGIVVTASITSVIVNYYNEIKDKKDDDKSQEEAIDENNTQKEKLELNTIKSEHDDKTNDE